jgi:predicted transcriptional regulator
MRDIEILLVKDVMTPHTARIRYNANLHEAAETVAMSGVSDLMVVDEQNNFVGVLSEGDILRGALPDIDEILGEGGSLETAFDIFLSKGRNLGELPIAPLVIQEPIVVDPDDHVAKATTVLIDKQIRILPVVRDGRIVGTISRSDICRAVVGAI